jgi:hypothetical protein
MKTKPSMKTKPTMQRTSFKRGRAATRPYILLFSFLLPLSSFLFAFAVTYRVDSTNGPETLAAEVKEAFDAWVALSSKIEIKETQENPEGIFQYGATERFGSDTLSLTVQRQSDTRSLIYLISPNAENRKRILLHETGIAIGLTPQIPGTPLPVTPTTQETPVPEGTPTETPPSESDQEPTFETTPLPETPPDTTSETPESAADTATEEQASQKSTPTQSSEEAQTTEPTEEPQTTENQASGETSSASSSNTPTAEETSETTESTSQQPADTTPTEQPTTEQPTNPTPETSSDTNTEEPTETPTSPTLTPNSVMNPSISPDDRIELGEVEKQLVERLQLFVSQDINKDSVVNFYDLVALSQAFGRSGVNDPADINKDGLIDQRDVDELQKIYTFSDPSENAPGSSPTSEGTEPTDGTTPEGTTDGTTPGNLPPPQEDVTPPTDGSAE